MHPSNNLLQVYIFADAPHMLKLAKNHLLDHGFVYCGNIIDKKCFVLLLKLRVKDLTIVHKLTKQHLHVVGTGRQKVKFAAQLFSHTNAKAIKTCGKNGIAGFENWETLFYVLDLFDKWFDIFNSRTKYAKYAEAHAFGIEMEKQCKVLREMNKFITSMRVCGRNKLLPFQKGISLCCQSLPGLFKHLK
ncbi:unnamed protein product [Lasius platythorax]|uniref:Transposable element P transposase-like GTP-binding insertion domain-containing protein n=1 Tax=Lasius platythorax TaxID=488582 RepID=A0AAV2NGJ2_9HYME